MVAAGACRKADTTAAGHPFYLRGMRLQDEGKFAEAVEAYESCLRLSPTHAEAHLQAAIAYEDRLNAPIDALWHYAKYLELSPAREQQDQARRSIARVTRNALPALLGNPEVPVGTSPQTEAEALRLQNEQLARANEFLVARLRKATAELAQRQPAGDDGAAAPPPPTAAVTSKAAAHEGAAPQSGEERSYIVKKNDTLSDVARYFYGSVRYWRPLREANSDLVPENGALTPGMRLRIPPKEKLKGP